MAIVEFRNVDIVFGERPEAAAEIRNFPLT